MASLLLRKRSITKIGLKAIVYTEVIHSYNEVLNLKSLPTFYLDELCEIKILKLGKIQ